MEIGPSVPSVNETTSSANETESNEAADKKYKEVGNIQGKVANILQVQPDLMAQAVGGDIQDAMVIFV